MRHLHLSTRAESFVDENEALSRALQIVCRYEIAVGITYKLAKDPDAQKDDRATIRRRQDVLLVQRGMISLLRLLQVLQLCLS